MNLNSSRDAALEGYKEYLKNDQLFTDHHISKNTRMVEKAMIWAEESCLEKIGYPDVMNYIRYLKELGEHPTLINKRLLSLRHYFDYENYSSNIYLNVKRGYNPADKLQLKGGKKKVLSDLFEKQELEALYDTYQGEDKVMVGLFCFQGMKALELERLEVSHLDFRKGTIYIQPSRRSKGRLLTINVTQLFDLMQLATQVKEGYLFGTDLRNRVFALFKRLRQVNPKVRNAHQLRASLIVHWIQKEGIRKAQHMAGHTTIAGTEKYRQVDMKALQQKVNDFHPLKVM